MANKINHIRFHILFLISLPFQFHRSPLFPQLTDHCSLFQDGAPGPEPAGSEGAKFRLWVKSKGLTLSRGPGVEAGTLGTEAGETEDTSLYLPTGTEQVRARHTQRHSDAVDQF